MFFLCLFPYGNIVAKIIYFLNKRNMDDFFCIFEIIMPKQILNKQQQIEIFELVYSTYLHKVEYYAYNFILDRDEAKNVAQDVFVRLWEKRDELDFSKELSPYLFVLAKNICLNILRHNQIKNKHRDITAYRINMFNINALKSETSDKLLSKEVEILIKTAYDQMPDKVKETFILSREENLKNREIAQLQGISISTVEFRLSYAFKIFRKYLKDYLIFLLWFFVPIV